MMDERKRQKRKLFGLVGMLAVFFAVGLLTSRQTPKERITAQLNRHYGAVVFVRSGTGADRVFLDAIGQVRPLMRGSAALITISRDDAAFLGRETQENAPALVVIEPHGEELQRFHGELSDEEKIALEESIRRIAEHQHTSAGGRGE